MPTPSQFVICLAAFATLASGQNALPADYAEKIAVLEQSRNATPNDLRVLDALASSYAMGGRYKEAVPIVKEMIAIEGALPELQLRLAKYYAWNLDIAGSLEQLNSAQLANHIEAQEFRCQLLSNYQRAAEAAFCYASLLNLASQNRSVAGPALLGLARNRVWSGDSAGGFRSYEKYVAENPGDRAATVEYIRLLRYRGQYAKADKLCLELLAKDPKDAEVLALRSQVLYWSADRKLDALHASEQAVYLNPELPEARVAHIAALEALGRNHAASGELQAFGEPSDSANASATDLAAYLKGLLREKEGVTIDIPYSVYNDSDGIHNVMAQFSSKIPIRGDHSLALNLTEYTSSAPMGVFTDGRDRTSVREFSAGGTLLAAPGLHISMFGGGSMRSGEDFLRPIYSVKMMGGTWNHLTLEAGGEREYMKLTPRAIDQDVHSDRVFMNAQYRINSRTSFNLAVDRRWWSDTNHSVQADASLTRTLRYGRRLSVDGGGLAGFQAYEKDLEAVSGFFNPDRYSRYDGFLDFHGEAGRLVRWEFRGEGGTQQIVSNATFEPNWSVTSRLSIGVTKTVRLYASYERRNYSFLSGQGWYQGFYISLGVRP